MSDYLMKEKKDEKKMQDMIKNNCTIMKNNFRNYKKLISSCETFSKSEQTSSDGFKSLADGISTFSTSGINDLDNGIVSLMQIMCTMQAGHSQIKSYMDDTFIPFLKKSSSMYTTSLSNFEKRNDNEMKRVDTVRMQAEKRMKSGDMEEMKKSMEEVKNAEKLMQQSTVQGLKDTSVMVREMYCSLIDQFCDMF